MALSGMVMFPVPKVPKTWRRVFGSRNIYRSKVEKKEDDVNDDDDDDNSDSYDDDDKQVTSVKKSTRAKPNHGRKSKR